MANKVTPLNGDNLAWQVEATEVESLIQRFFEKLVKMGKSVIIKYFPRGQFSCEAGTRHLPASLPENVHANSAWVGFTLGGVFYRTESIACRKTFVAWLKEILDDTKDFLWQIITFGPPKNVFFYTPK